MRGLKQFVGRKALVSTSDGGALAGVIWRARRDGIELRKAREVLRDRNVDGVIWIPASSVVQVQIVTEAN